MGSKGSPATGVTTMGDGNPMAKNVKGMEDKKTMIDNNKKRAMEEVVSDERDSNNKNKRTAGRREQPPATNEGVTSNNGVMNTKCAENERRKEILAITNGDIRRSGTVARKEVKQTRTTRMETVEEEEDQMEEEVTGTNGANDMDWEEIEVNMVAS